MLVDTSAFYAQLDRSDKYHQQAAVTFRALAQERRPLLVTNLIVAETHALINLRLGNCLAARWLAAMARVPVIYEREQYRLAVLNLLEGRPDESYSYTDAFSFVAMEQLEIRHALSYDRHFRRKGVTLLGQ